MRTLLAALAVAALSAPQVDAQSPQVDTSEEQKLRLIRWIATHAQRDRDASGAELAVSLLGDLDRLLGITQPTPPGSFPLPTWTVEHFPPLGLRFTRLADGETFFGPTFEEWRGADSNSTKSRNNQPAPGWVPGDVLGVPAGTWPNFRWTATYDWWISNIAQNPTRLGDPVNYPDDPYTYLTAEGLIRYGLNNRDKFKGLWTKATPPTILEPAYPAWVKWGHDPQTWIIGAVDAAGHPSTIIGGGRTYGEWIGAASFANIEFRGPVGNGSEAIFQTERPVAELADGTEIKDNWPENPDAVGGEWQSYRDLELRNCWINGEWDFETASGVVNKWGSQLYEVGQSSRGDDVAGFSWIDGGVVGISGEHCYYFHNTRANSPDAFAVHLSGLELGPSARTAVQMVSREHEGPDGQGWVLLEYLTIRDTGLEDQGGGYALSFHGNHDGLIELRYVDCRLGANPDLHPEYQPDITGGFVCTAGGGSGGRPTREIRISDSHFQVGPHFVGVGGARRANLWVGNVSHWALLATSVHQYAGAREALYFDVDTLVSLELDALNDVRGHVRWGAKQFDDVDAEPDGLMDGAGWAAFVSELRDGVDGDGDGEVEGNYGIAIEWK